MTITMREKRRRKLYKNTTSKQSRAYIVTGQEGNPFLQRNSVLCQENPIKSFLVIYFAIIPPLK